MKIPRSFDYLPPKSFGEIGQADKRNRSEWSESGEGRVIKDKLKDWYLDLSDAIIKVSTVHGIARYRRGSS